MFFIIIIVTNRYFGYLVIFRLIVLTLCSELNLGKLQSRRLRNMRRTLLYHSIITKTRVIEVKTINKF